LPLGTMSAESGELVSYLISALWIVTGLCAIVVVFALGFFYLTARATRDTKNALPELHQFGESKARQRQPTAGMAVVRN
jgi:hypothetical protein